MRIYSILLVLTTTLVGSHRSAARASHRQPSLSSTLLRLQRLYLRQPPHDTSLYDTLHVSPNATAAEITKSYRKLSRMLHPDKQTTTTNNNNNAASAQLERVRAAYDVLKEDRTRLRYHRHGLLDAKDAVSILTGRATATTCCSGEEDTTALTELLQLMGYNNNNNKDAQRPGDGRRHNNNSRVVYIATHLFHTIQPVLDGRISVAAWRDTWQAHGDRLKRLPLGAQIVRCIGRAYRAAGQRVLLLQQQRQKKQYYCFFFLRDVVRQARHMATAAVAGGRVLLEEHKTGKGGNNDCSSWEERIGEEERDNTAIDDDDTACCFDDDGVCEAPTEQELQRRAQERVDAALLESLQIEALWKICKIDLDRTVRKACELVLSRERRSSSAVGWVSERNGVAVATDAYQAKVAKLLVLLGDTLVMRSKQGTSWLE